MFGNIAGKYDRMNRIMSLSLDRLWRRKSLDAVPPPHPDSVLDLACGTGDFTLELLKRFPKTCITCVDITPEMIDVAKAKLAGRQSVRFVVGDAQNLSGIPDGSFGLAVCGFGFRNFPDKASALAECRRVLAGDGRLVVLELFRPQSRFVGAIVNAWLTLVSFVFANAFDREYAYLRQSVSRTVSADEFAKMAETAGFSLIARRSLVPSATALVFERRDSDGQ